MNERCLAVVLRTNGDVMERLDKCHFTLPIEPGQ
jgi:hypothetical protein